MKRLLPTLLIIGMNLPIVPNIEPLMAQIERTEEQIQLGNERIGWRITCTENGRINTLEFQSGDKWNPIDFRMDSLGGPQWYGQWNYKKYIIPLRLQDKNNALFVGQENDLFFSIKYTIINGRLAIIASIRNNSKYTFEPIKAGIILGLDTYMDKYPDWNRKFFPTLLRCEKTHFWGYAMTPKGRILSIASPDPIASWSLNYKHLLHKIYTLNLDLLNAPPLPSRHPRNCHKLEPGEERRWTIFLEELTELSALKPRLADICNAPMFEIDRYTVQKGESINIIIYSGEDIKLIVSNPSGKSHKLLPVYSRKGEFHYRFQPEEDFGVYTLIATNISGKQSEAKVYLRRPWSWYLKQARKEAIRNPQKTTHGAAEAYYGFFSLFLAKKHFPDVELDAKAEANFQTVFPLLFDAQKIVPRVIPNRIQNTSSMCSVLADRYQATGDIKDLELASGFVDFLISHQGSDGGYYTYWIDEESHGAYYTSVIYIAKSIMEVMAEGKKLASQSLVWRERYEKHYQSVKRAMDDLARRKDNIQTEGEMTFEDGMISCSATQLAMFALLQKDPEQRRKYTESAVYLMWAHRCLSQLAIPDCRMNGGTIRFWEAQYDLNIRHNLISSPHGWSAWRIYGLWYLYLLTGEEEWLTQAMNALGSCVQLIDSETGKLRWGFMCDPYIKAGVFQRDPYYPSRGFNEQRVIGEKYLDLIGDWFEISTDNLVHEIFKCLEEVALTSAYIIERSSGEIITWNCRSEFIDKTLHVYPSEEIVNAVHVNLHQKQKIVVHFLGSDPTSARVVGMKWIKRIDKR